MNIFVDNQTGLLEILEIDKTFRKFEINPSFYKIQFTKKTITLQEMDFWLQKQYKGKNLIITTSKIQGKGQLGMNFDYHGIANELNGTLGIITLNQQTAPKIGAVVLHEALHLLGLNHCKTHGCIMAFKLCDYQLRYCLNCQHPCVSIHLCENCKRGFNANSA